MGNGKELIDIEVIRNDFKNKMIIFGVLAIIVIATASIIAIKVAESYNQKLLAEQEQEIQEEIIEEAIEEENTLQLPVYSEEAKSKIDNIYKLETEEKKAYLTFDDGPSSNVTPQILQILEEEEIKATFFVLGSRAELYPELVKQEYEAGHYIANHRIFSYIYSNIFFCKCSA